MKLIYTNDNLSLIRHLQSYLDNLGINTSIKNEYLSGAAGELPPTSWPELWVIDAAKMEQAQEEITKLLSDSNGNHSLRNWKCSNCKESNEGQFAICWSCGTPCSNQ